LEILTPFDDITDVNPALFSQLRVVYIVYPRSTLYGNSIAARSVVTTVNGNKSFPSGL
jgi:hypothetical protein